MAQAVVATGVGSAWEAWVGLTKARINPARITMLTKGKRRSDFMVDVMNNARMTHGRRPAVATDLVKNRAIIWLRP